MPNRRSFIKNSSLLSAALLLNNDLLFEKPSKKIGLQLYTLRHVLNENNVAEVMAKIAAIGYREVELFGSMPAKKFWGKEPKEFSRILKANGLKAISLHDNFDSFFANENESAIHAVAEIANTIGAKYITVAWLNEKYRKDADDYKKVADKLNVISKIAKEHGLKIAYHNHDFEFKPLADEQMGYDILLSHTDKSLVQLELDLYWITKAGKDPVKYFEQFPGRFPMWHLKDMDKKTGTFTEVGKGLVDFKRIFARQKLAGVKHLFVEQDETVKDVFESVKESFGYVKKELVR